MFVKITAKCRRLTSGWTQKVRRKPLMNNKSKQEFK